MGILRRLLGIFVMIAGIIGLILSLAGLVGIWFARPVLASTIDATVLTLTNSIDTSQKTLVITNQALGATASSVDSLSAMLGTTALTVEETQPVFDQMNGLMSETLPATFEEATASLDAASEAAASLESAIQSFEMFRAVMGSTPFLSGMMPSSSQSYTPDKPLAESLSELAVTLQDMPATFTDMSVNLDKADDNLVLIQTNLNSMSTSVAGISTSLQEYQAMISESQASMEDLKVMLASVDNNLGTILNVTTGVLALFFLWMLAAQVVIFSQGLELFNGTASRMGGAEPAPAVVSAVPADPAGS